MNDKDKMMLGLVLYASDYHSRIERFVRPIRLRYNRIKEGLILIHMGTSAATIRQGKHDIIQGFKHMFGQSDIQKRDNMIAHMIDHVPVVRRPIYRELILNQLSWVRQGKAFNPHLNTAIFDDANIVPQILDNMACLDLVGIQPMQGPVGMAYMIKILEAKSQSGPTEGVGRKVTAEICGEAVMSGTRKLQAQFTPEAVHDVERVLASDGKTGFQKMLATEIGSEMDNEVLTSLERLATVQEDCILALDTPNAGSIVALHIQKAANQIGTTSRRGCGNWAIVSPLTATLLMTCSAFDATRATTVPSGMIRLVGVLNKSIKIYVDPIADAHGQFNTLVGYKGYGEIDAGYFFHPYVPLVSTGVVIDPRTFCPVAGLATRFGITENESANYYVKFNIKMEAPNVVSN